MSRATLKAIQAAAGNAGEAVYVDDVFSTYLYTGDGNSNRTIENGIDLAGEGGMVWIKARQLGNESSIPHVIADTESAGSGANPYTGATNSSSAYYSASNQFRDFASNGFIVSEGKETNGYGSVGYEKTYASWTFRKQPGFFDVVTYTGDNTTERQIPHSLGSTPGMIIVRATDNVENWAVWHRSVPDDSATRAANMWLNTTDAAGGYGRFANNSDQTSTYFTTGVSGVNSINYTGRNYIAYLFAHDAQDFGTNSDEAIIKCGSYTGNGNTTTGQDIDVGFEPQFIMVKGSSVTSDWSIYDSMRGFVTNGTAADDSRLMANRTNAESLFRYGHFTSNGFNVNGTSNVNNGSGQTYIYVAIRRPHKPASEFAATDLFAIDTKNSTNATQPNFYSGWPIDFALKKQINGSTAIFGAATRLLGAGFLRTNDTDALTSSADWATDYSNGWFNDVNTTPDTNNQSWMFRRAPGFFDVVAYTGGTNTFKHNLGVVPELILIKRRDSTSDWAVYSAPTGNNSNANLNLTGRFTTTSSMWNTTTPTATEVTLGSTDPVVNVGAAPYIAYLFATVPGISKIGSYTGTSATQNIDCGFTNGARFVLVKRSSGTDPWILWDSERGIVAGNDPYLELNSTAAQVTTTDYIDPLNSGFTLTAGIGDTNFTGQSYIFLAIA